MNIVTESNEDDIYSYICVECREAWKSSTPPHSIYDHVVVNNNVTSTHDTETSKPKTIDSICTHLNIVTQSCDSEAGVYSYLCTQCKETWKSITPPPSGKRRTKIWDLPHEIILKIFTYLTALELGAAAIACKTWSYLTHDPHLYIRLDFSGGAPSLDVVDNVVSCASLLQTLVIKSRSDANQILHVVSEFCPLLKCVEVSFCDNLEAESFEKLASACPQIETLNIEGSRAKEFGFTHSLARFKQLKELNMSHCTCMIDPKGLISIAKHCPLLQELNIDGISYVEDDVIKGIIEHRRETLVKLMLDGEQLTDTSYREVSKCSSLGVFGVSFAEEMSDVGLLEIGKLSRLMWLKIKRGQQLSDTVFPNVFYNREFKNLIHLDLSECSMLTDDGVREVARACRILTCLALSWCWELTDLAIDAICQNCRYLRILDLIGVVRLTGDNFHAIPACLPHLEFLDLEQCGAVEDAALKLLAARMPGLKVLDYYGDEVCVDTRTTTNEYYFSEVVPMKLKLDNIKLDNKNKS